MGSLAQIPGLLLKSLDKFKKLREIIQQNGGLRKSLWKMYIMDDLKDGQWVGVDRYGNKYYQNPRYFYGRNRWVEYAEHQRLEYDGSQVPAEWFGWLHYKTDLTPCNDPSRPCYPWMQEHTANLSGTKNEYMPYTTTRPKIEVWQPKKTNKCG